MSNLNPSERARVIEIIRKFPPVKTRVPKLKLPSPEMRGEETYKWLINKWMPSQADFDNLAELVILFSFDVAVALTAIVYPEKFIEELEKESIAGQDTGES